MLQMGLDGFARQATTVFTSGLRTVCLVHLVSVDQRSYAEYVESLGASTYMTMFAADPMPGSGILELPLTATMACLDHMLGGPGGSSQPDRPLTEIESAVFRGFVERLLSEMRYSLEGIVALEPSVTGVEYSPQFAQAAGAADVMVVATFDLKVGEHDARMTFCLPFSGLLPHLVNASAPTARLGPRARAAAPRPRRCCTTSSTSPGRRPGQAARHPRLARRDQPPRGRRRGAPDPPVRGPARRHRRRRGLCPCHRRCPRTAPRRADRGRTAEGEEPMTILPSSFPLSEVANENAAALLDAANAAAGGRYPPSSPLAAGTPRPGSLGSAAGFAGAAIADFEGLVSGSVAVLVGAELVQALASSPLGSLDLAAAMQPALDAAAAALGARVGAARTVTLDLVINDLGYPFTVVPLEGSGGGAALLLNDGSLEAAAQAAAAAAAAAATRRAVGLRGAPRPRSPTPRSRAGWRCCTASSWTSPSSSAAPG